MAENLTQCLSKMDRSPHFCRATLEKCDKRVLADLLRITQGFIKKNCLSEGGGVPMPFWELSRGYPVLNSNLAVRCVGIPILSGADPGCLSWVWIFFYPESRIQPQKEEGKKYISNLTFCGSFSLFRKQVLIHNYFTF
jgi:hypothetical protein